jgi:lysozyme
MVNNTIDISHYQSVEDTTSVKDADINLVILKATQGVGYTDPMYIENTGKLEAAEITCGAYHFGTGSDAKQQADNFLAVAGHDRLLALDFESNPSGTQMTLLQAQVFVEHIKDKTGRYPGLYTDQNTIKTIIGNDNAVLSQCWLWVARYGKQPDTLGPWNSWTLWQYTDGTTGDQPHGVSGIKTSSETLCDRDKFYGDISQFDRFMAQNTGAASA